MKFLVRVSNSMYRFANRKYLLAVFVLFIAVVMVMQKGPSGSSALKELSGGTGMLDMQLGYNQLQVYNMLDIIGEQGRQLYSTLLGIDFVFAVVFMLFQSLMITAILRKAAVNRHFKTLNMLPLVSSALDMIENCFILTLIFNHPIKLPFLVGISSTVTILKWIAYIAVIAFIFSLGVVTTWRGRTSKKKLQKEKESGTV